MSAPRQPHVAPHRDVLEYVDMDGVTCRVYYVPGRECYVVSHDYHGTSQEHVFRTLLGPIVVFPPAERAAMTLLKRLRFGPLPQIERRA